MQKKEKCGIITWLIYGEYMKKLQLTKTLNLKTYNEDDFLQNQKQILDDIQKILGSFDYDNNLETAKEYLFDLNSEIFLNNKKVNIFVLYREKLPLSFAICADKKLVWIWTHFEYTKLGYATILLRALAFELKNEGVENFSVDIDTDNFVAQSLFESFSKIDKIKIFEKNERNGKKTCNFDIKGVNFDKILQEIENFAI